MAVFWGSIDYFATGEGRTIWYYLDHAKDEATFRQKMIDEFDIPEYYHVGLVIKENVDENTPLLIFEHWRSLTGIYDNKRISYGKLAYHCHFNYS